MVGWGWLVGGRVGKWAAEVQAMLERWRQQWLDRWQAGKQAAEAPKATLPSRQHALTNRPGQPSPVSCLAGAVRCSIGAVCSSGSSPLASTSAFAGVCTTGRAAEARWSIVAAATCKMAGSGRGRLGTLVKQTAVNQAAVNQRSNKKAPTCTQQLTTLMKSCAMYSLQERRKRRNEDM